MRLSWLKRVTEGHAEREKRRESGADHGLRPELVPSADFRRHVGLAPDALEFLGEEIRDQERRFQRERLVDAHPKQPVAVRLDVTGTDLLRHDVGLRWWRAAKQRSAQPRR